MYIFPLSSAALVLSSVHGWIFCLWPVGLHGFLDVQFPAGLEIHRGVGSGDQLYRSGFLHGFLSIESSATGFGSIDVRLLGRFYILGETSESPRGQCALVWWMKNPEPPEPLGCPRLDYLLTGSTELKNPSLMGHGFWIIVLFHCPPTGANTRDTRLAVRRDAKLELALRRVSARHEGAFARWGRILWDVSMKCADSDIFSELWAC